MEFILDYILSSHKWVSDVLCDRKRIQNNIWWRMRVLSEEIKKKASDEFLLDL